MSDAVTQNTVCEFALRSEQDLRTAFTVADAVPQIKEQIVRRFLEELKRSLTKVLGRGWSFTEPIPNFFEERYGDFSCWKDSWKAYDIGLCGQNYLRDGICWGIGRDRTLAKGEPNPDLVSRFKDVFPEAKSNRNWESWVCPREREFRFWNEPESLIKLHYQTDDAVRYFSVRLLKAAEIAVPLLDKMSKI